MEQNKMKTIKLLPHSEYKVSRGAVDGDMDAHVVNFARALDFLFGEATVDKFFVPLCKDLNIDHRKFMIMFWNYVSWYSK
jgi:hypothetical protein